jgi:hypothetical protein
MPTKPKSLIDEYDNHTKRPGKACGVAAVLELLDADTASQFVELLNRPDVEHQALGRLMRSHGHDISGLTIGRHRCGDCRCSR